jgi:hypothetical protein
MKPLDDDRLDLSPLDPTRDAARFEAIVRSVAARAAARPMRDASSILLAWWRPALALAASLALVPWGPSLLTARTPTSESLSSDPAAAILEWARAGAPSSAAEVLDSLGKNR